ncbi:MAG TPA: NAD(P)H-hydrate epimerase [Planctomycetota bacterium]|nr:NAD(P)H-hydrate epimerase [Planctomycetota bacterium]
MQPPAPLLLSRAAVRELDRLCTEEYGIPGIVLMENAGRGVAEHVLRELRSRSERVVFLCGPGNNGGDAFVAARHLRNAGAHVELFATSASTGDAAWARSVTECMGLVALDAAALEAVVSRSSGDVVLVDALLGTGATGAPRGVVAALLRAVEGATPRLRIALDVPTGLDAETGFVHDPCFRADWTLTFAALKPGLVPEVCGRTLVLDIGAPRELVERLARA